MNKLINTNDDTPEQFYIFVDRLNPITRNNFKVSGTFASSAFTSCADKNFLIKYLSGEATYLPYGILRMDCLSLSPYFLTAINDYRIEHDAEVYRKSNNPTHPSRLSAIFAFGDYQSCQEANRKYKWPLETVKRFSLIDHPLNRIVKANMEHVSLAKYAYKVSSFSFHDIDQLWKAYWSATGNIVLELPNKDFKPTQYESGVIWEYLIEGAVKCID